MLGTYGKHPAFGDFISHGVTALFHSDVVPWIGQMMSETRDELGDRWASVYDTALPLRFWIGANVFGGGHMRGVLLASRDKVGRRYPLIIVQEGAELLPPVLDKDQRFYDAVQAHLEETFEGALATAAELTAGLQDWNEGGFDESEPKAEEATFWAANPDPQVDGLLDAVAAADHQRAAGHRSYWWVAGRQTRASAFLATQGVPTSEQMAWLLTGVAAEQLQQPDQDKEMAESNLEMEGQSHE